MVIAIIPPMEYLRSKWGNDLENLKFQVYDQRLQLIFSGKILKGQNTNLKQVLEECSLLFDTHDTGYFLQKH